MMREDDEEVVPAAPRQPRADAATPHPLLPTDDRIIVDWARECLEAGNTLDAGSKLERISTPHRNHPDVLKLRQEIYFAERRWHAALEAAKAWAAASPNDPAAWEAQAACLGELRLYQQAVNVLLPVANRFARRPELAYRLARLCAEMGRLEESQRWLFKALDAGDKPKLARQALADTALQPLIYFLGRRALVEKIVAGGLTGAERAALEFAERHGIEHAGWSAHGHTEEEQRVHRHFKLVETGSSGWQERTDLNAQHSDATAIFSISGELAGAASRALEQAQQLGRPYLLLQRDGGEGDPVAQLLSFLEKHRVRVLNVAGTIVAREAHIGEFVTETLEAAFDYQLRSLLHGTLAPASPRT
jgi:tetratricopeptide (TPR) repeat protein